MNSGPTFMICDVVGCEEPPTGTYLDATTQAAFQFRVCAAHFSRLEDGEQPVIITEPLAVENWHARPVMLME